MAYFDGHMHSTFSDGNLSVPALVAEVLKTDIKVMALTDHDTMAGHEEAREATRAAGLEFCPGVEMSLEHGGREIHILAYFVDAQANEVKEALQQSLTARRSHIRLALQRLEDLGFHLTEAEVLAEAADQSIGRPHIAKAMVKKGYVSGVNEAFQRYLADGKPGHVPRKHTAASRLLKLVNDAGGVCSTAHPGIYGLDENDFATLKDQGLGAIEVYHPEHSPSDIVFYLRQCERFGLIPTGGSDYHAALDKPHVRLGSSGLDQAGYRRLQDARR